jgi:uncharacterized membrane protein
VIAVVGLALLAVVVIAVIAYGASHYGSDSGAGRGDSPGRVHTSALERWAEAGLITDEQVRAIREFESARRRSRPSSRVSPAIEALAYVGGVLLAVGAGMLVGQFWDRIGTGGHLGVVALAGLVTGVVGVVVGESDPAAWRLRGFLWMLSAVGVGAFAGLFVFEVLDASGEPVAFATATAAMGASAGYWQLRNRPLQHAITFVALAVAIGVGIAWVGTGNVAAWIGLALWCLGAAWAGLAWTRRVPPPVVGFALGAVLTLIASGIVGGRYESLAPVLGLVTAVVWVGVGVAADEGLALAPGVVGIFVFLPWTLGQLFGETLGAPAIVMLSGALLLGVVMLLLRRRRGDGGPVGGVLGGHFRRSVSA